MRFAALCSLLCAALLLGTAPEAQTRLDWEPVGSEPVDADLPFVVADDGALLLGGYATVDPDGAQYEGVWRLPSPHDTLSQWVRIAERPRAGPEWVLPLGGDTLIVEDFLYYYRSVDGGQTWEEMARRLGNAQRVILTPGGIPYGGRIVVATGSRSVSYSADRGATWQYALSNDASAWDSVNVQRLAVVTTGPRAGRLVGAGLNGITTSDDGGATWAKTPDEWAYFQQSADCVATLAGQAPGGGDRLVAVVNDIRLPDDSVRVTVSDDGGDSWQRPAALPRGPSRTCTDVVDLGGGLAAAVLLRGPVYGTRDGGSTWDLWSDLTTGGVEGGEFEWAFAGPAGRLYVGWNGGDGPRTHDLRTTVPVSVAVSSGPDAPEASGAVLRVSPNPSSGAVRIEVETPTPEAAEVVIVDARGREVARAVASGGAVEVSTMGWSPGVYVARAVVGGEAASARFTVVR